MARGVFTDKPVRVAILADRRPSYVNPMAEGLDRMVRLAGGESEILYEGLDALRGLQPPPARSLSAPTRERADRVVASFRNTTSHRRLATKLRSFDVAVVVQSIPNAFLRSFFSDELVRALLGPVPLVLYDVFYLPTRGMWAHWLHDGFPAGGVPEGGHWGLERYDWYLCASVVSEVALPFAHHPVSLVGLHLDDGTLRPEQHETFIALLDFEHPPDMHERAVQLMALQRTRTSFVVLNGHYSKAQIRRIYRRTSMYFVAMRESFGLPICELQACGSLVFTPYSNWCPSHWKKNDLSEPGEGRLSPNFVVYDNDIDRLAFEIERARVSHAPALVRESFIANDGQFFHGDIDAVTQFLEMIRSGAIHSRLHLQHEDIPIPPKTDLLDWPRPRPEASGRSFASGQDDGQLATTAVKDQ